MLELFVVGSFWFWALIAVELILLFVFVEYENGIGATISLVAFAALLQWCGNADLLGYMATHPWYIATSLAAYFLIGSVWGIIKWRLYCSDRLDAYEEMKSDFIRSKRLPATTKVIPPEHRAEWKDRIERTRKYGSDQTIADVPLVRLHKAMILRWMTLWVVSMVWSFANDFLKRIFREIYRKLAAFLQTMADNVWKSGNISEDLNVPPPVERYEGPRV